MPPRTLAQRQPEAHLIDMNQSQRQTELFCHCVLAVTLTEACESIQIGLRFWWQLSHRHQSAGTSAVFLCFLFPVYFPKQHSP